MSITDELRKLGYGFCGDTHDVVTAIADRIDAEHESACAEAYGNGVMSVPIALDESQWIKLPVDADGVPIRIGDRMEVGQQVFVTGVSEKGFYWLEGTRYKYGRAGDHRHHHEPTVEDVLREFVSEFNRDDTEMCDEEIIERFAAKLKLVDDGEEQ